MSWIKIAGIVLDLQLSIEYLESVLLDFQINSDQKANLTFLIPEEELEDTILKKKKANAKYLMQTEQMSVIQDKDELIILYTKESCVKQSVINTKTWNVIIDIHHQEVNDEMRHSISIAIRDALFTYFSSYGYMAIHSASILYHDKAYLFAGSSGTGKSTHTKMWEELYQVPILNGDVTVIGMEQGEPVAYGIPWCGTSNRYLNRRVALGGIIFLSQCKHNEVDTLSYSEIIKRLIARSFNPNWDKEFVEKEFRIAEELANIVPCYRLRCMPNKEAVEIIKEQLDY